MMMLRSLKGLAFAFLALFLIASAFAGAAISISYHASIARLVDKRIASVSGAVVEVGGEVGAHEIARRITLLSRERDTGDIGFSLRGADGRQIAGNVRWTGTRAPGFWPVGRSDGIEGLSKGRAFVRELPNGLTLTTIGETEPFDDHNFDRMRAYALGFGAIMIVVFAGTFTFAHIVRGRLLAMQRTVDAIIKGDMRQRVPVDNSGSEFDRQAVALNRMLDRIEELLLGIRSISDEIAHDLRTPLARLRARLSLLAQREEASPLREEIGAAIEQSDEILKMFEAVLRIVEVEGGARRAAFISLDIRSLAADLVDTMQTVGAETGHHIRLVAGEPLSLHADRQLLNRALMNLIDNALRHTPPGTEIAVDISIEGRMAVVSVSDNGPGIPSSQHGLALRRFGRLDKSRGAGGHGLGLPLAEAVARLHHGTLALEDAAPGLAVVLRLPLDRSSPEPGSS